MEANDNGKIPKETIQLLMKGYFKNKQLKVDDDVLEAISEYMHIFVEEATLRSLENRDPSKAETPLEYDDLEKIIGTLMLDM